MIITTYMYILEWVQFRNILNESIWGGREYLSKVNGILCTIYTGSHDVLRSSLASWWLFPLLEKKAVTLILALLDSVKGEHCDMLSPKQLVDCLVSISVAKHVTEEIRSCLHCQNGGFPVYCGKLWLPLKKKIKIKKTLNKLKF